MATAAPLQPTPAHKPAPTQHEASSVATADTASSNARTVPVPSGDMTAQLSFYCPPIDGSKPVRYVGTPPPGEPQYNFSMLDHDVTIHDLRGRESSATTDTHSFAALRNVQSRVPISVLQKHTPENDEQIKQHYYPEVEQLLLNQLSGSPHRVLIFDHTIRHTDVAPAASVYSVNASVREPAMGVHVDQTAAASFARVERHVKDPDEVAKLVAGRVRLVNVWRPLGSHPVASFPLAVADGSSVRDEDMVAIERRYPDYTGETACVKYNREQRWYYWSGMVPEERLLLKCFDSDSELGSVGRAPHTAFADPRSPEDAPPRQSIEVRCLVFG